ncbi:MAG: fibronectin type III-like domain-contianing protein [Chitinophagaceae bacterium]
MGRPLRDNHLKEDYRSSYYDMPNLPLYPFGYRFSYTDFSINNVTLNKNQFVANDSIMVQVTVKNTGKYDAENTIQLYIRDVVGSMTRSVKELKGFQKIFLKKGESKKISFMIKEEDLKFFNQEMQYVSEHGEFIL